MTYSSPSTAIAHPADNWRYRPMVIAGSAGVLCGVYARIFDFWQVGTADTARGVLDLLGFPLLLTVAALFFVWFVGGVIALFRRRWRNMTSCVLATLTIAAAFSVVTRVPLFDPWFWYVIVNKTELEVAARGKASESGKPLFAVIDEWDISTGFAGVNQNHFIALVYDGSDGTPPDPSNDYQAHVYGHFYLRERYE